MLATSCTAATLLSRIADALMRYYNAPLPWTSVSVSRILPETAWFFAGTLDSSLLDTLTSNQRHDFARLDRSGEKLGH